MEIRKLLTFRNLLKFETVVSLGISLLYLSAQFTGYAISSSEFMFSHSLGVFFVILGLLGAFGLAVTREKI
jgi:hypothetical protein